MLTGASRVTLDIPRDRAGTFDPKLIARYQRRFPDFDEKIISMYARGMTVREIRGHLEDIHGIDVSPDLISAVTDAVLEEVAEWRNRPLDACYPLVFVDAIRVKIRDEGFVRNKAVHIALCILPDGTKEIPGLRIEQTEGAEFRLRVMNELGSRGLGDILVAVVDGLKGFPEAINAVFPETVVQLSTPEENPATCRRKSLPCEELWGRGLEFASRPGSSAHHIAGGCRGALDREGQSVVGIS